MVIATILIKAIIVIIICNLKTAGKSWHNGNASWRNGFIAHRIFPLHKNTL